MRPDDNLIISHLDDEWRTAPAVHRLLGDHGTVADVASALERLARAGKIEAKHEAVMTGRAGPPVLCIDYYRKLQKWPKSSSVDKLPADRFDRQAKTRRFSSAGLCRCVRYQAARSVFSGNLFPEYYVFPALFARG